MRVWLINHYASSMFVNRGGRHYWFAKILRDRGYDTTVFCANTFLSKDNIIDTHGKVCVIDNVDGIPFVFVKTTPYKGNGFARIRNMFSFYIHLFAATKQYMKSSEKPAVIIASSVHPLTMVAGIQISKKLKVPCICEIRDLWPEAIFSFGKAKEKSLLGKILIAGEHWIYRNAQALIFTKEGDTDYLKERGWTTGQGGDIDLNKCHYINNGVNLDTYRRQIQENIYEDPDLADENTFKVIYAGTIRPVNNVGNLVDCASILQAKGYSDVRFLIFGAGSEMEKLKKRIEDEKLNNIKFKGLVEKKYIPYILSRSSVNILNYSSKQYNWTRGNSSNKLFEYMASGKPIISTAQMGYSIIKKYQCGVELKNDTAQELSEELIKFKNMSAAEYTQYAENAENGVREFDFEVLTTKLEQVIGQVMNRENEVQTDD